MVEINKDLALEHFQKIVRVKTVSNKDDEAYKEEFRSFLPLLKELYPETFKVVEAQLINEFGILLYWKGKNSAEKPIVLMAHHDVVSDEGQNWKHPAFEAEIIDDVIWGRGTIDNKCIFTAILEAMEGLIKDGFTPERDIYFASSNNEEVAGETMPEIAKWFEANGITPEYVLDEGGAVMLELPMGVKIPYAMIGLSEKGFAKITLTASSKSAAHSAKSVSSKKSAPEQIIDAVNAISKNPTPSTITPALEGMLKAFAPNVDAPLKQVFNNINLLKPVVKKAMESIPDAAAMIRTQITLTSLKAFNEKGTVPDTASATYSVRLAPQDRFDDILAHIKKVVGEDIEIETERKREAPPISDFHTDGFEYIKQTVKKVYPGYGVAPFILNAATDSRHFSHLCNTYRFGAFAINNELFSSVHNEDERLPVAEFKKSIDFYVEFMKGLK